MNWYAIYQGVLQRISLACLAAIATATGVILLVVYLTPILRWIKAHKWDALIVAPFVLCLIFSGSTKHIARITYPRIDPEVWYLRDYGSYVTNDTVHISFTRNIIIPATAWFYLYGLESTYTNESDWAEHSFCAYSNTFANISQPLDIQYANASNYNWMAFTDWTPPPVTHTNGVAYVVWQVGANKGINELVPYRTGVYTNGFRVAPGPAITNGPPFSAPSLRMSSPQEWTP